MEPNLKLPQPKITNTTKIECKCGNALFTDAYLLRKLSKLLSGQPKDTIINIPVLACSKCGEVLQDMVSEELK